MEAEAASHMATRVAQYDLAKEREETEEAEAKKRRLEAEVKIGAASATDPSFIATMGREVLADRSLASLEDRLSRGRHSVQKGVRADTFL
jgi:hypothetical protein